MKSYFANKKIDYTGQQLTSHFAYNTFDLQGDSITAFIGQCEVKEHMVDLEDIKQKAWIYSPLMLHFIVEHFDASLKETIILQRLLTSIIAEEINTSRDKNTIKRSGDDLYYKNRKLSVSIATISPVSTMIHIGLNIETKNTPVKTAGLKELKVLPKSFATQIMKKYCEEIEDIYTAKTKVKSIK